MLSGSVVASRSALSLSWFNCQLKRLLYIIPKNTLTLVYSVDAIDYGDIRCLYIWELLLVFRHIKQDLNITTKEHPINYDLGISVS